MARVDWRQINVPITEEQQATARREMVRDKLYYGFRYANGSYKARKAMIHPFLMVAKREGQTLRLYDNGSHQPTKNQEAAAIDKFKGWRIKEREIKREQMPAYRQWLKEQRLKDSSANWHYWLEYGE